MLTDDSFGDFISMFFSSKFPSPGRGNAAFKLLHRAAAFIQPKPSKKTAVKMPIFYNANMCVS
jgi:hypothetical protein